ncbi:Chaperonin Cpn60/TCP-1 family, partial [Trinorchestia longiramus]
MIQRLKDAGATLVMCQWGFDDEANSLLLDAGIAAVRWVGGPELELVAVHTGARIVARFEDLGAGDLGEADVREESVGTQGEKVVVVEGVGQMARAVTILVRGSNDMAVEEAKRCVRDALCAVRTIVKRPRVLYGGGCAELSAAAELAGSTDERFQAFARALRRVPMVLAENAGLDPYAALDQENPWDGVDCLGKGRNMK